MKYCVYSFLLLVATYANAQNNTKKSDLLTTRENWNEGSIMLNDGTELKGLVRYDDRNSVLAYQDGENSKAFTPRSVAAFEFFDEKINTQRVFYTFPYEDSETNAIRPLFFERLREFKNFTVLAKVDPIDVKQKRRQAGGLYGVNGIPIGVNPHPKIEVLQVETIYIMNLDNVIKPYIKTQNKQDGTKSLITGEDTKSKEKMLDRDLLAITVSEPVYEKLKLYARENDLSFKYKEDLLKILDYYGTLAQ